MSTPINKDLLISRFSKSFGTYGKHAEVQETMAKRLFEMIHSEIGNKAVSAYEFGCGNGMLTQELLNLNITDLLLNDLAPSAETFLKAICDQKNQSFSFVSGDAEAFFPNKKYDLIASGSTVQWFSKLNSFFSKIANCINDNGHFAFSTFGPQNLLELQKLGLPQISYQNTDQIESGLADAGFKIIDIKAELHPIYFPSPTDVLSHLKLTGVNAICQTKWTKGKLIEFCNNYSQHFKTAKGHQLTYHSIVIIAQP